MLLTKNRKAEEEINLEAMIRHSDHIFKYAVGYRPRPEILIEADQCIMISLDL